MEWGDITVYVSALLDATLWGFHSNHNVQQLRASRQELYNWKNEQLHTLLSSWHFCQQRCNQKRSGHKINNQNSKKLATLIIILFFILIFYVNIFLFVCYSTVLGSCFHLEIELFCTDVQDVQSKLSNLFQTVSKRKNLILDIFGKVFKSNLCFEWEVEENCSKTMESFDYSYILLLVLCFIFRVE